MYTSFVKTSLQRCVSLFTSAQFLRYLAVGLFSFGLDYGLYWSCIALMHIGYLVAHVTSFVVMYWLNFLMHRHFSFRVSGHPARHLVRYTLLLAVNVTLTTALLAFLTGIAGISPFVSKIAVMAALVAWNFIVYRKIVYA